MDFDFQMDTGGLEKLLKKLPGETKKKVTRAATRAGANVIRKEAKLLAPFDPSRTGGTHLKDAIVVKRVKNTNDIMRIGVLNRKAPHGHLQEFGTIHHGANPFLRPAADNKVQEAVIKVFKVLARGIFREARKLAK